MSAAAPLVILAGATGSLGNHIAVELKGRGADVRAIVRQGADAAKVARLRELGVEVVQADYGDRSQMVHACEDGTCVVSALAGLRNVIIDAQSALLEGAVKARVPRGGGGRSSGMPSYRVVRWAAVLAFINTGGNSVTT
ncbi:MAG: NmrA family NAD(P)-binding protein [Longimicrobiales bacterium]